MGRMSMVVSLELRHLQCIDAIIFRMGADELHESDLSTEIEGGHQAIVSSCDLKSHALAVQHLGFRSRLLDLIGGCLAIICQRSSETFASGGLPQKLTSTFRATTRMPQCSMFPKREQAQLPPKSGRHLEDRRISGSCQEEAAYAACCSGAQVNSG